LVILIKSESVIDQSLKDKVIQDIKEVFKNKNETEIFGNIERIFAKKNHHLLSIFELSESKNANELDEAILKAFIKANAAPYMAELCLLWNRFDIAKNFVFNETFDFNSVGIDFKNFILILYSEILQ
jgi:hypothetical protein